MSPALKINKSSLSETNLRGGIESPTQSGVYWFQSETTSKALMVEVRLKDGQLTEWSPNQDVPVTNVKGVWRGPIRPFARPNSS